MQTYLEASLKTSDSTEETARKLYLAVISVGEQIYSAGSHLSEIQKKIDGLENEVVRLRRELEKLLGREIVETTANQG